MVPQLLTWLFLGLFPMGSLVLPWELLEIQYVLYFVLWMAVQRHPSLQECVQNGDNDRLCDSIINSPSPT